MRAFLKLLALSAILSPVLSAPVRADPNDAVWDHNGSLMRLETNDDKRRFVYDQPREALDSAGVKRGTILFDGKEKKDGRLAGYAKLFRTGCDPVDYFVEGPHDREKGKILLQGQAPIYSGDGCKITGYTDDGSASSLTFTLQGPPPGLYADRRSDPPATGSEGRRQREASRDYLPPRSARAPDRDRVEDDGYDRAETADAHDDRSRQDEAYDRRANGYGAYQAYGDDGRNVASHRERNAPRSRYDESYEAPPRNVEDYADYEEDYEYYEDDGPAYYPYQPRWRRDYYYD